MPAQNNSRFQGYRQVGNRENFAEERTASYLLTMFAVKASNWYLCSKNTLQATALNIRTLSASYVRNRTSLFQQMTQYVYYNHLLIVNTAA